MAIRLLSNESIAGNLQFTGSDPTAIYRNSGGIQIKAENIRIKGVTTNENIAAFIENGAVELYYDNSQKFVTTSAGITVTGTTINLDSAASAGYIADRANDTSGATYEYKTGGSLKWYTGLRGVSTEDFYIFNNAQGSTALLLNSSNNFATFAGEVSLKSRLFLQRSSGGATTLIQFRNENGVDKAHIDFGGTNEELGFFAGAGSSEHMTITSTGLVGIGTNNPQSNLHISTSSTNAAIRLQNDNGSASTANIVLQTDSSGIANDGFGIYDVTNAAYNLTLQRFSTGSATSTRMTIGPYVSGTKNIEAWLVGVDENHSIKFRAGAGNKTYYYSYGGSGIDLGHNFYTGGLVAQQSLRLGISDDRIIALVNVGIGTTSPGYKLDVTHVGADAINVNASNDFTGIRWSSTQHTYSWRVGSDVFFIYDVVNAAQRVTLDADGNLGIGTASPNQEGFGAGNRALSVKAPSSGGVANLELIGLGNADNDQLGYVNFMSQSATNAAAAIIGLRHTSDESGKLTFVTAGSERMRITENGNVGIGTDSPLYKVQINAISNGQTALAFMNSAVTADGNGSTNIRFVSATNAQWANASFSAYNFSFFGNGSEKFTILGASGNVGIGETSPQRPLHINGTEGVARFTSTASGNNGFEVGIGTSSQAFLWQSENSYMQFATNNTERMRVNSSGNVGIGTTSPAYKLQVSSTTFIEGTFGDPNTDAAYRLKFYDNGGVHNDPGIGLDGSGGGGEKMWFNAYDGFYWNLGTQGVKMTLTGTGNVGIGNTSPNAPLQFQTIISTRKIVLFEVANNDYQFYGFGIEGNTLVYSVGDVGDRHVFFAGSGTGTRNELMRINGNGNVGIGTNSPAHRLQVEDNGNVVRFYNTGSSNATLTLRADGADGTDSGIQVSFRDTSDNAVGSITSTGNGTAFNTSSDYRLKENVVEMTDALDRVSQLKPSRFNFIANPDKTYDGFLAHEVQDIVPEAISGDKDEVDEDGNEKYQGIDQSKLVPLLVGAIQELKKEIEILKNK